MKVREIERKMDEKNKGQWECSTRRRSRLARE